jgi:3'-phosphoadenosine 5'-phosphosulfate sulfotransferase (PAPS reductase)/FAD synthetase
MSETVEQCALFTAADVYEGDPLRPGLDDPTPAEIVAALSKSDRHARVEYLVEQAWGILDTAIATYAGSRDVVAECLLFSGGNDSTVLAHIFHQRATHAIHANTTIGIEETRQFVRDTCADWGLPLIEKRPPDDYRALVLGRVTSKDGESVWAGGFPGPGAHWICYQRLKERCLDAVRHDLGIANSRTKCAVYIAGRRRQESERREDVPLYEGDGSVIWASPLAMWTKFDLNTYREMHGDVPENRVSGLIHMSGECLCGAFAHPGELDEIGYWFPEVRAEIDALAAEVKAAGFAEPLCIWGHGEGVPSRRGRLCSSCTPQGWQAIEFLERAS